MEQAEFYPAMPRMGEKISCIMATAGCFAKGHQPINEAIESFKRQYYRNKELIILNDTPGQVLVYDDPSVKIINHPERFESAGARLNAAIAASDGTYIAPWDECGISLPWRLAGEMMWVKGYEYVNLCGCWMLSDTDILSFYQHRMTHTSCFFSRKIYDEVGGYPLVDDCLGFFYHKVPAERQRSWIRVPSTDSFYIRRWSLRGDEPRATGTIQLAPSWGCDWIAKIRL